MSQALCILGINDKYQGGLISFWFHQYELVTTVVPTKSDSDEIFCLQLLSKTPLELTRIERSLVY